MELFYTRSMGFCCSFKISRNYAIEIQLFSFSKKFRDGVTFLNANVNLDMQKADHKPSFEMSMTILNMVNRLSIHSTKCIVNDQELLIGSIHELWDDHEIYV